MGNTNTNKMSPSRRLRAYSRICRVTRQVLTPCELSVLFYLVDAAAGYGRDHVSLSLSQMLQGSWTVRTREDGSEYGYRWLTPVKVSRASLVRSLEKLRNIGILAWSDAPARKRTIAINLLWKPEGWFTEMPRDKLPTPKRLKVNPGANLDGETVLNKSTVAYDNCAHHEHTQTVSKSQTVSPSSRKRSDDGWLDDAEKVIRDVKARPKKPKKSEREATATTIWKEAWAEGRYDTLPPGLSAKARGQLSQALARWPKEGEAVVRWTIINWRQAIRENFVWMTTNPPPTHPHAGFLLKFIDQFHEAYAEQLFRDRQQQQGIFTDKAEFDRLVKSGMPVEKAWEEMGRRKARQEHQVEIDAEKARIAREFRAVADERQALKRERQVSLTREQREAIIREARGEPLPVPKRDYWSEDGAPLGDFGEWKDDDEPS